jgi:ComF family protein
MWKLWSRSLIRYWFPEICAGCERTLLIEESWLCLDCLYHLPITNHLQDPENDSAKKFWGIIPVVYTASFVWFKSQTRVQHMIKQIKYRNKPYFAYFLGQYFGQMSIHHPLAQQVDGIVPIPLHPSKKRKRGYNQSGYFAKGIAQVWKKPLLSSLLIRIKASKSQTVVSKQERFSNITGVFALKTIPEWSHPHVLLVDDVLTTGATLTEAAQILLKIPDVQISIFTLARAH